MEKEAVGRRTMRQLKKGFIERMREWLNPPDYTQTTLGIVGEPVIRLPIRRQGEWRHVSKVAILRNDILAQKFSDILTQKFAM